jgi:hypothetical protein
MVGGGLGLEQLVAADAAFRVGLADARLVGVAHAARHRARRHEQEGQVTEARRADEQARDDLVADAEQQSGVECRVRQRRPPSTSAITSRENSDSSMPGMPLGDAVAHGRHPAGHLRGGAGLARGGANQRRVALERLVGREHVVVGGDDGEVRRAAAPQRGLVLARGREGVGEVGAGEPAAGWAREMILAHAREIFRAPAAASLGDALGDLADDRMQFHEDPSSRSVAGEHARAVAQRIGSIQRQAASTSSRRMNSVWLPRTTSISSRS